MLSFQDEWAIFKLQMKIALEDKIAFFYTLVIPAAMLFINKSQNFQDNASIYIYWSYIVVSTILNGFLLNLVRLRENGFLKTFSYIVGSKYPIIITSLFVQLLIIQVEILLFNFVVTIFITKVSWVTFLYGFLTTFWATIACAAMLSGLLLLKVKQASFNILINLFLLLGLIFLGLHPSGIWKYLLTIINPFQLIDVLYAIHYHYHLLGVVVLTFTIIYLIFSFFVFMKMSIKSQMKRV
ncbi:hypothetical protein [Companilactobacillus halodurans]|uniref:Uncharacterized protein n=1 Tax=Companilactobacillus halodurans TaxID=2584183 RepID=A0A5P0ZVY5_9LACO|nr:hypothetical protein [Companilactobacillus halodurans]MQS76354.1 hypothetical protein [Companilactobacillus halodurans]MQS96978.1 hypothetical protein [Companilactobacillus halodurans]